MAGKRSKATEEEILFIGINPKKLNQEELADRFDLSLKVVAKIQAEYKATEEKKAEIVRANSPKEETHMRTLLVAKTNAGKGVAVMQEGASELLDSHNAAVRANKKRNKYKNDFTTKIFPDE